MKSFFQRTHRRSAPLWNLSIETQHLSSKVGLSAAAVAIPMYLTTKWIIMQHDNTHHAKFGPDFIKTKDTQAIWRTHPFFQLE